MPLADVVCGLTGPLLDLFNFLAQAHRAPNECCWPLLAVGRSCYGIHKKDSFAMGVDHADQHASRL